MFVRTGKEWAYLDCAFIQEGIHQRGKDPAICSTMSSTKSHRHASFNSRSALMIRSHHDWERGDSGRLSAIDVLPKH